jgi:hypothetical protein
MHVLLLLLLLAMLFPVGLRALLGLVGWALIIGAVAIGMAFANFKEERRAECLAHHQDAAWFAAYDCGNYVRSADDSRP